MKTWYNKAQGTSPLDYSKPIAAFNDSNGEPMLLMPCLKVTAPLNGNYEIQGFNWFRVSDGDWNSCTTWPTAADAVRAYERQYDVRNVELNIK